MIDAERNGVRESVIILQIGCVLECGKVDADLWNNVEPEPCRSVPEVPVVACATSECERAEAVFRTTVEIETVEAPAHFGRRGPASRRVFHVPLGSDGKGGVNRCAGQRQRSAGESAAVEEVLQVVSAGGCFSPVDTVANAVKAHSDSPWSLHHSGSEVQRETMALPRRCSVDDERNA